MHTHWPQHAAAWDKETKAIAKMIAGDIKKKFLDEIERLLNSGALDEFYSRGLLFGVAIENVADGWLRGDRKTREYRNLKRF